MRRLANGCLPLVLSGGNQIWIVRASLRVTQRSFGMAVE